MKVLSIVGARPQFVKLAPISWEIADRADVEHVIVHTGQHYDHVMSDVFFDDLAIPSPAVDLHVGSAPHAQQTAAMLDALGDLLPAQAPDCVLVYGDTNSTLAGALAAVKLHIPVAHLEAGLRSHNRRMPEEHNRVLTDHASDRLLAPTSTAMTNLAREGLAPRSVLVGDVMLDVLTRVAARVGATAPTVLGETGLQPGNYYVATIHRAENTDDPDRLAMILGSLSRLDKPVLLLEHPRLSDRIAHGALETTLCGVVRHEPLPYPDLVAAVIRSAGVVTDSGGLQKEAFFLRVPCTTVRTETEWTETVDLGWNLLANTSQEILAAVERPRPTPTVEAPYGAGHAARLVVDELCRLGAEAPAG